MSGAIPQPISQRAFAKILGVSAPAVGKAIKAGRLVGSVVLDADGVAKIADVELARREWAGATDYSHAPTAVKLAAAARAADHGPSPERRGPGRPRKEAVQPTEPGGLAHESAREKRWRANRAELEYMERVGQLVDARQMQAAVTDAFTRVRAKLGGIPGRTRQRIPHLTVEEVAIIESLIREALEELALGIEQEAGLASDPSTPA